MVRVFILGLIVLITLGGCVRKEPPLVRCRELTPDAVDVSKVVIEYARELQDTHRLFLYDSRIISDGKINKIRIDFTSMANVEMCEARKALVDVVEGYIKRFRNHVFLNTSFWSRPITARDFEIHITYRSYFNRYVDPEYVAYTILEDGWSYFYNSELNNAFSDIWMQKVEPYYETRMFTDFKEEAEAQHHDEHLDVNKKVLEDERFFDKQEALI